MISMPCNYKNVGCSGGSVSLRTWTLARGEGRGLGARRPALSHSQLCTLCSLLPWASASPAPQGVVVLKVSSDLEAPGVKFPGPADGHEARLIRWLEGACEGSSESQLWSLPQKARTDVSFLLP